MMFKHSNQENLGIYIIFGTAALNLWSSVIFSSASDIERERYMGTLELITSVPTDFKVIMLGKVLGNILLGLLSMVISYAVLTLLFDVAVTIKNPTLFLLAFIITIISFAAVSLLLASIFTLSRNSRALMNSLEYPVFILSGVLFPIDILPMWIKPLSYLLSPTWAVMLLRESMLGVSDYKHFILNIIYFILITMVYVLLIFVSFKRIDRKTRINATLGVH